MNHFLTVHYTRSEKLRLIQYIHSRRGRGVRRNNRVHWWCFGYGGFERNLEEADGYRPRTEKRRHETRREFNAQSDDFGVLWTQVRRLLQNPGACKTRCKKRRFRVPGSGIFAESRNPGEVVASPRAPGGGTKVNRNGERKRSSVIISCRIQSILCFRIPCSHFT